VLFAYDANALAQNWITALLIARMSAVLTKKLLMSVAPTRMGYKLTTRKLSPSRKLPLMATTASVDIADQQAACQVSKCAIKH
jgi:hypothetical protein